MEHRRILLAGALACLVPIAFSGSAQRQYNTAVFAHFVLRLGAVWPALYGFQGKAARAVFVASAWGMAAIYCTCIVCRAWLDPSTAAALELWLPPVFLSYFRRYPFRLYFAYNLADQVHMRKLFPAPVVVLLNAYYAIVNSYAVWKRLPGTATSPLQVVATAVVWTVVAPFLVMQLFEMWRPGHRHTTRQPQVPHNHSSLPAQPMDPKQPSSMQQDALPTAAGGTQPSSSIVEAPPNVDDRLDLFTYKAAFLRTKVVAKVHTSHSPSQLPHDFASAMQTGMDGSFQLLSMAVRSGCVCIRIDAAVLQRAGLPASPDAADWQQIVDMLLQRLLPMLQQELAETPDKPVVQLHVGQKVLSASWNASAASWQLRTDCSGSGPATQQLPTLGLAQQLQPATGVAGSNNWQGQSGVQNKHASGQAMAVQPLHIVHVLAQLVTGEAAAWLRTRQLAAVEGWSPPSSSTGAHDDVQPDVLQLMACCSGTYVSTCVLEVSELKAGGTMAEVKLELHVPDNLLPRHHVGGAPVGLFPVSLELWQGALHCISSTPLLLQLPAASSACCWWWGATSCSMQRAVRDLQQASQQHWQHIAGCFRITPKQRSYIQSAQAFYDDLILWLEQIKLTAVSTGQCVGHPPLCGPACTLLHQPSLTPQQLAVLGEHLLQYSPKLKLHGLSCMLQQQSSMAARQLHMPASQQGMNNDSAMQTWGHGVPVGDLTKAATQQGMQLNGVPQQAADRLIQQGADGKSDSSMPARMGHATCDLTAHVATHATAHVATHATGTAASACTSAARCAPSANALKQHCIWRSVGSLLLDPVKGAPCVQCEARFRADMIRLLASVQGLASSIFVAGSMLSVLAQAPDSHLVPLTVEIWAVLHACIALGQLQQLRPQEPRLCAVSTSHPSTGTGSHGIDRGSHSLGTHKHSMAITAAYSRRNKWTVWLCAVAHMWRVSGQYVLAAVSPKAALKAQLTTGLFLVNCLMMSVGEQTLACLNYSPTVALVASFVDAGSVYAMLYQTSMLTTGRVVTTLMAVVLPRLLLEARLRAMLSHNAPSPRPAPLGVQA